MEVVVVGKHTEVDSALRALTVEKVQRVAKFASDVRRVDVDYEQHPTRRADDSHTCEILVHVNHHLVKGMASAVDHPTALDRALDKVEEQMRRLHERRVGRRNGGRARGARPPSRRRRRRRWSKTTTRPIPDGSSIVVKTKQFDGEADERRGGRAPDGAPRPRLLLVHERRLRPGGGRLPPA